MAKEKTIADLLDEFEKTNDLMEQDVRLKQNEQRLAELEKSKKLKLDEEQTSLLKQIKSGLKEDSLQTEEEKREANKRAERLIAQLGRMEKGIGDLKGLGGGGGAKSFGNMFAKVIAAPAFAIGLVSGFSERTGEIVQSLLDADDRKGIGVQKSREAIRKAGQNFYQRFTKFFLEGVEKGNPAEARQQAKGGVLRGLGASALIRLQDNIEGLRGVFNLNRRAQGFGVDDFAKGRFIDPRAIPSGEIRYGKTPMGEEFEKLDKFRRNLDGRVYSSLDELGKSPEQLKRLRAIDDLADQYNNLSRALADDAFFGDRNKAFDELEDIGKKYQNELKKFNQANERVRKISQRFTIKGKPTGFLNYILRGISGLGLFLVKGGKFFASIFNEELNTIKTFFTNMFAKTGLKDSKFSKGLSTVGSVLKNAFTTLFKFGKSFGKAIPFLGAIIAIFDTFITSFKRTKKQMERGGNIVQVLLSLFVGAFEGLAKSVIGGLGDLLRMGIAALVGLVNKDAKDWINENITITKWIESLGDVLEDLINSPIKFIKGLIEGTKAAFADPLNGFNAFSEAYNNYINDKGPANLEQNNLPFGLTNDPMERAANIAFSKMDYLDRTNANDELADKYGRANAAQMRGLFMPNNNTTNVSYYGNILDPIDNSLAADR
jgi:hypothetical protein